MIQHYAAIGRAPSTVSTPIRFVVANPSVMLYWTSDRPVPVSRAECDQFNTWYYSIEGEYFSKAGKLAGSILTPIIPASSTLRGLLH